LNDPHEEPGEQDRALGTYVKLMRCVSVLDAGVHRPLKDAGLTSSQFGVLEALFHLGPMCQKEVGRKLLLSGGNITTVVTNLERRGLIQRTRDPRDRRFVTVELTATGHGLIADLFPAHASTITEMLAALTPEEQEQLGGLCRKLGRAVVKTCGD